MKVIQTKGAPARESYRNVVNTNVGSGRIVISADVAKQLGWKKDTEIQIALNDESKIFKIILYKGNGPKLRLFKGNKSFTLILPKRAIALIPKAFHAYRSGLKFEILKEKILAIDLEL